MYILLFCICVCAVSSLVHRLHLHHLLHEEVTVVAAQVMVQVVAATRAVDAGTILTSLVPLLSMLGTRTKVLLYCLFSLSTCSVI